MATKAGKVVTYNEELLSIKSHDLLIKGSSDLDFFYMICTFRVQTFSITNNKEKNWTNLCPIQAKVLESTQLQKGFLAVIGKGLFANLYLH